MIKLVNDTIDSEDITKLIEWLQTSPQLSKGPQTIEFERLFAATVSSKHAIFVNSGSAAILLTLWTLWESGRMRNNKVVVPDLSWATDYSSVLQLGMQPIICPPNMENLSVDLKELEIIFKASKPAVLLLVSVLGLVPNMDRIVELCNEYGVLLVEDACESLGSGWGGKDLGTWGKAGLYSFYYGHHISTIEGGMIVTDDTDLYNCLLMNRSHGWVRDLDPVAQEQVLNTTCWTDFQKLFLFFTAGFNCRSTDLQATIGLNQLKKLHRIKKVRNYNYRLYLKGLDSRLWKPTVPTDAHFVSNFGYPVITKRRWVLTEVLKEHGIECRPLISGAISQQPFYKGQEKYQVSYVIHNNGLYLPNHPGLKRDEIDLIIKLVNENA